MAQDLKRVRPVVAATNGSKRCALCRAEGKRHRAHTGCGAVGAGGRHLRKGDRHPARGWRRCGNRIWRKMLQEEPLDVIRQINGDARFTDA